MSITAETKIEIVELAKQAYDKLGFFNEVEFKKDVYNIFIIKKMITRYLRSGNINEKLILNNIIIAINTFEIERANQILRMAMNNDEFSVVKSFLLFLDSYTLDDDIEPNEIITAILLDVAKRHNLVYRMNS